MLSRARTIKVDRMNSKIVAYITQGSPKQKELACNNNYSILMLANYSVPKSS